MYRLPARRRLEGRDAAEERELSGQQHAPLSAAEAPLPGCPALTKNATPVFLCQEAVPVICHCSPLLVCLNAVQCACGRAPDRDGGVEGGQGRAWEQSRSCCYRPGT